MNTENTGGVVGQAYDAVVKNKRRKTKVIDTRSEDKLLRPLDREQIISNARNVRRNSSSAAFAIRKHLDFVSSFTFQCRSGNSEFDKRIEELMAWWSRPQNCDVTGRFSLSQIVRILEGLAVVDGDAFIYKLQNGQVQIIEGDRVKTPTDLGDFQQNQIDTSVFTHGVQTDKAGKAVSYAICERTGGFNTSGYNQFKLQEIAQAQYVLCHAYRDRYDQIRGVSPLSSALNTFSDIYEAREYALAKMKISQIFGLKFRHATTPGDDGAEPYTFNFGDGPQSIELDGGDDAEFMESSTPSTEFQEFIQAAIQDALKSLDIPYSFYDESHTNYSGARQGTKLYEQSVEEKREPLRNTLNALTIWRLQLFIADGVLELPPDISTLDDITFEWVGASLPAIDPVKESVSNTMDLLAGLTSPQRLCKEKGEDYFQIIDEIAAAKDYRVAKGLNPDIQNVTLDMGELLKDDNANNKTK